MRKENRSVWEEEEEEEEACGGVGSHWTGRVSGCELLMIAEHNEGNGRGNEGREREVGEVRGEREGKGKASYTYLPLSPSLPFPS